MNTTQINIHKKNLTFFLLLSLTTSIFLWYIPFSNQRYSLSFYPVIATFAGVLHIQTGCFMTMNYMSYRRKKYLLPLACGFYFSGVFLFLALYIYFYKNGLPGVIYNDIAVLYFMRNMLITGLFFATYYLYTFKNKKEKHGKTVIYATYLWCMLHLVMAILYSIRITPISFQLVDTETFEWLRPWRGSFIYVLIILWTCIVLLGAKLTRLKTQFWVSMSLVALSNLLSVIIMLKYTHIDSAGWYLARGLECLSAMAVMIVLMSDIFKRYKASRQAYELSYENSVRDPMTRLFNRGYFYNALSNEIKMTATHKPLSIVFCDIDFFKSVNDTWGHLQGDRVIIKLAEIMQRLSRRNDIVARIGGEEFAILLPETNADAAFNIAERIRKHVEQQTQATTKGDFPRIITISLGIVTSFDNRSAPEQLADCADRALYMAKNRGRNCVVAYSGEEV